METENVEIIKAMVRNGLGISIIPWQAAAADVQHKQLFCSRIAGHLAGASDRLALPEDEPAAARGVGSDPGVRDDATAARSCGAPVQDVDERAARVATRGRSIADPRIAIGRSEYDVARPHVQTCRVVLTSIFRVRRSGSGLVE